MIFVLITFFAAFLIEGIGTYVSVVGLSALFSSNPVIIMLAVALDIGKIVTVSFLYKHWKKLNVVMKTYMLVAAAALMVITSTGAAGYLSAEFQKAIVSTKESDIRVAALKEEKIKLEARKKEIDGQIANLPSNAVKGRTKLIKEFKDEIEQTNVRITQIVKELPEIEISKAKEDSHAGPILYIAKAFNITVEEAVKWVILLIIFVFDPLAIVLIIGGNFLIDQNKREKEERRREKQLQDDLEREHKYKIELEELKHKHELEEEQVEIEKLHELIVQDPKDMTEIFECTFPSDEDGKSRGTLVQTLPEDSNYEPIHSEFKEEVLGGNDVSIELKSESGREEQVEEEVEEPEPTISTEEQLENVVHVPITLVPKEEPTEVLPTAKSLSMVNAGEADVSIEASPSVSLKSYNV